MVFTPGSPETGSTGGSVVWSISDPLDSIIFNSMVPSSSNGITWHGATEGNSILSSCPSDGMTACIYVLTLECTLIEVINFQTSHG